MKYLPLKLSVFIVLLFTLVIAACFLWTHLRIRQYVSLVRSDEIQERIKGFDELLSMGDKGEKALVSVFPDGEDAARLLIDGWQDVDKVIRMDNCTCAQINHAARKSWWDTTLLLIWKGAAVNGKDSDGCTPLHRAAAGGRKDVVNALLARGADLHAGMVPKGNYSPGKTCWTILILRQPGAGLLAPGPNATPLHFAAATGQKDVAALLISKGADISAKDINGHTPLYDAAWNGNVQLVDLLLSEGASVNGPDSTVRKPLDLVLSLSWDDKVACLLISKGADVGAIGCGSNTILHDAALAGMKDTVAMLLDKGFDVNARSENGDLPLHYAARLGKLETIRLLIEKGSDVNTINHKGKTPLDNAQKFTDGKESAKLLRAHGGLTGREIMEQENRETKIEKLDNRKS